MAKNVHKIDEIAGLTLRSAAEVSMRGKSLETLAERLLHQVGYCTSDQRAKSDAASEAGPEPEGSVGRSGAA